MSKDLIILGSTGSIGTYTLKVIDKEANFKIKLLSTKKNANKLYKQAIKFKVKTVVIEDPEKYKNHKDKFEKKNIKIYLGINNIDKILKKKVTFCINSITGIEGLEPTLKVIKYSKNILIANKESIVCGWELIKKKLKNYKTNFIPIDSEHFSINELIKSDTKNYINKIVLTASGGPFLNKNINLSNIRPEIALKHPNWKMGKKISIDSSNLMNKIFEFLEAKKIFNLRNKKIDILIHPSSYIHAIVFFKTNLIKFLAHDAKMTIPITNALGIENKFNKKIVMENLPKMNNINFQKPNLKKFPLLEILKLIPENYSYFETILVTLNDELVSKYLSGDINYLSIQKNLLKLIKNPYFKSYYKLKPKNIYDIKNMIDLTKNYLNDNLVIYEK